jgi:rubredoxin-NAD+ reductase
MAGSKSVVIIGSGLSGYSLAREFRKLAPDTPVTVITADGGEVYSKPMLSNAFAQGKTPAGLVQKPGSQMAAELRLTLMARTRVTAIDRAAKHVAVTDADGIAAHVPYNRLVLAWGADPRPFAAPGSDGVAVHSVNDLDDYGRWRQSLGDAGRILIIGAGLVGSEFADDLSGAGHRVTLVDPGPWPLGRLAPEQVGKALGAAMADVGMTLHMGRSIARLETGRAWLADGAEIVFDRALSAIGLVPRTKLAADAGLAVDRGIVVDRLLQTSDPDIYAMGDCSQTPAGPLPFVAPLMAEAKALAATLAGTPTPLVLPALPVVVKTPCLPTAVCPPAPGASGTWVVEGTGRDLKALFVDAQGKALGFALTGGFAQERQSLGKTMPELLSPGGV